MNGYHGLATSVTFLKALLDLDFQNARIIQAKRCRCGGALHCANYPRSPRGVPSSILALFSFRWSFCCSDRECRRRTTPPSICFLGRRWYLAAAFVVMSMLRHGVTPERAKELHALIPVDDRTLSRWREWWCRILPGTPFWRMARGRLQQQVDESELPASLADLFLGEPSVRLRSLLVFLSDLTTSACRRWKGSVRVA